MGRMFLIGILCSLGVGAFAAMQQPVNKMCPVLTEEPIVEGIVATYQGKTIGFCCPMCRNSFLENPTAYVANLPDFGEREETSSDRGHDEHDHSEHAGGPSWIAFLGRFHPLAVHFPIALLLAAALFELIPAARAAPSATAGTRAFLYLGLIGALAAAGLGWAAAAGKGLPDEMADVLFRHRWIGTGAAVASLAVLVLLERSRRAEGRAGRLLAYRIVLFLASALVAIAGHYGASLVYGIGYLFGA